MPILQLALDLADLERALKIAEEAAPYVDWLEAGTPLIKSEGLNSVRELRKRFPSKKIVADMKIADTGAFEVELAAKAGADIVTVMAVVDDSTIREAVKAGERFNAKVMADMLGVSDIPKRVCELKKLGVHYACLHIGIDQQMRGVSIVEAVRKFRCEIPFAVAGGVSEKTVAEMAASGAEIIIVGGAITKAAKPGEAAKAIRAALLSKKKFKVSEGTAEDADSLIRKIFLQVSTPNIADAMQRSGAMVGISPVVQGAKMAGRAVTVRTYPGDWAKAVEAIDVAKAGEVLVIEAGGAASGDRAVWGELATHSAAQKKLAGIVIDGGIRDVDEVRRLKFPAFSRYISPNAGDPKGLGEIGCEVRCCRQAVRPGDWIVGDDNGVVVVPQERAAEIANRAKYTLETENRVREEIRRGSTLGKVLQLGKWEQFFTKKSR
ncbi:Bifunctional enzyme Fae/Hps [Candidatus Burarchaeum australiense]|nr:Bifunctional enzyme Fae/Hps [Candidatus Burarchaeum australiense]